MDQTAKIGKKQKNAKVSFHSFPKDTAIRNLWINILDLNLLHIPNQALICSTHFKEEHLDKTNPLKIKLKPNALLYKTKKEGEEEMSFTTCSQPSRSKEDKATMVSLKRIYNSPEKCRLRKRVKVIKKEYTKQIRALQQNLHRRINQVATLKHLLDVLKEKQLLNERQADAIHTLGGPISAIFKRLIKKQKNEPVSKQYEPHLRSFALTLHCYSPRAYEYVRTEFSLCLPHAKTISSWYRSVQGNRGISMEGLESIKTRVKNTNYMLFGSLQFDEMAIREHLEYDLDMIQNLVAVLI